MYFCRPKGGGTENFMLLRRINAVISLLLSFLLIFHAGTLSVWMLSRCSIAKPADFFSFILMPLIVVHIVLSLIPAILAHKGTEKHPSKSYPKMNLPTVIQRATGILMIVLLPFHLTGAASHYQPKMLHAVLHPLFFAVIMAHTSISVSKALITLGIGGAKTVKIVNVIMRVLCMAVLVMGVIGFEICLFVGVAK
jgi:hypothetical protein